MSNEQKYVFFEKGWEKQKGDQYKSSLTGEWTDVHPVNFGEVPRGYEEQYRRPVTYFPPPPPPPPQTEDILEEALRITSSDRQNQYGPPEQDFTRTAKMWEALLEPCVQPDGTLKISGSAVARCMIAIKLSRDTHQKKRDNPVDIAGYARCLDRCHKAEGSY